ncbi:MAG: hypothetical protein SP1CHLAM54_11320 [Chlamydiia bacterium]|nr:hypothetical protein [Chlamydiia bacterium]MCH9616035.1 hypothetical protein [Chlamydiia bacterium]MCH9629058.1 hypothetical protein [Chlamydiia bacterium]
MLPECFKKALFAYETFFLALSRKFRGNTAYKTLFKKSPYS